MEPDASSVPAAGLPSALASAAGKDAADNAAGPPPHDGQRGLCGIDYSPHLCEECRFELEEAAKYGFDHDDEFSR